MHACSNPRAFVLTGSSTQNTLLQISEGLVLHIIQVSAHMSTSQEIFLNHCILDNTIRPRLPHHSHSLAFYPTLFYVPAVTTPDMLYTHLYFVSRLSLSLICKFHESRGFPYFVYCCILGYCICAWHLLGAQ